MTDDTSAYEKEFCHWLEGIVCTEGEGTRYTKESTILQTARSTNYFTLEDYDPDYKGWVANVNAGQPTAISFSSAKLIGWP